MTIDWKRFVLAHGWRTHTYELAAVLGQPAADIQRVRNTGACSRLRKGKRFAELFTLWHGRPPLDDEWPAPRNAGGRRAYEWQAPELALLASLVGRLGPVEISEILTKRLREKTGDRHAKRSRMAVHVGMQRIGLQMSDVVGGIALADAAREINAYAAVFQSIRSGKLAAYRISRVWVIPYEAWKAWKAKHVFPPKGYIQLSRLKRPLSIRSDKLSEWARMGYVPTAVRCNPYGTRAKSTKFGSWYVDPKIAAKLIADRRAGRPMPWWGKPEPSNLRITFTLWCRRKHPRSCSTCRQIWGELGAPRSYEEYARRYPPIAHGAKRHLTRPYNRGLKLKEVARFAGRSWAGVRLAVINGMLRATRVGNTLYVSRTDATRWKARRCPCGRDYRSWISIGAAREQYRFTIAELRAFIEQGKLLSKLGTNGPMRGITYVARNQCVQLRETIGFSEEEAARRAGVAIPRFRALLEGVNWRGSKGIPLETVQAVIKRLESREGYTLQEAAAALRTTESWLTERIKDGTIRLSRAKWDRRRLYITEPMLERLKQFKRTPVEREEFGANWLFLSDAAREAGVCTTMICRWAADGELARRPSHLGWRYHRRAVRARARLYWKTVRFHRAIPPEWLQRSSTRPAPYTPSGQLQLRAA